MPDILDFNTGQPANFPTGGSNLGNDLQGVQGLFGAAGTLLGSQANVQGLQAEQQSFQAEAALYAQAAQLATASQSNVQAQGNLEASQIARQVEKVQGTAQAVAAKANSTGSTLADILQENQRQGALAIGQAQGQTALQVQNFQEMALGFQAQGQAAIGEGQAAAAAAKAQQSGGILGALGGIVGGVAKVIPFL